jgi:hypothetical protein
MIAKKRGQQGHNNNSHNEGPEDGQHSPADSLRSAYCKAPYAREELRVYNDTHGCTMRCEEEVIEANRRLGCFRMSVGVLRADRWGVEEARGGDGVAPEAKDV